MMIMSILGKCAHCLMTIVETSILLIAVAEDLDVQLAKVISLLPKCGVVTPEDNVEDALELLAFRNAQHSVLQDSVSL